MVRVSVPSVTLSSMMSFFENNRDLKLALTYVILYSTNYFEDPRLYLSGSGPGSASMHPQGREADSNATCLQTLHSSWADVMATLATSQNGTPFGDHLTGSIIVRGIVYSATHFIHA